VSVERSWGGRAEYESPFQLGDRQFLIESIDELTGNYLCGQAAIRVTGHSDAGRVDSSSQLSKAIWLLELVDDECDVPKSWFTRFRIKNGTHGARIRSNSPVVTSLVLEVKGRKPVAGKVTAEHSVGLPTPARTMRE
jgi:hypothetical protein